MRVTILLIAAMATAACGSRDPQSMPQTDLPQGSAAAPAAIGWQVRPASGGLALVRIGDDGAAAMRLECASEQSRLLVNVPSLRPIGSEERMSFGGDAGVVALVADGRGDTTRGGVTGSGPVPEALKGLVTGPMTVSYGAQASGPHPAPPDALAARFLEVCEAGAAASRAQAAKPTATTSPCLVQDGRLLNARPIRAIGTEPFWGARIEGRCVTYSHPDDQKGTRVWTRINDGPDGGVWVGALNGKPFVLRLRGSRQCSDGMSDNVYSMAVELTVDGEERTGCAEPL